MQTILFIGLGGFVGAIIRFLLSSFVQKSADTFFPIGTLSINVLGGFLIGFLALYFEQHVNPEYRVLAITGFLGALTTFSTFSYETVLLIEDAAYTKAMANIMMSVVFSIGATMLGMVVFKRFFLA
ncbi:MAG TPA: fluoride efflux transporter CrcB [Campylobacterales bacterium]|nr:fluoride efflux transporter CrcB [Campylobacterales bacterium]